jgi:FixJ family two-component response regulator
MDQFASPSTDVFIVDDDPSIRELLCTAFSMHGYCTVSFAESASFLAATRQRIPAFILLDINMPGRSGLEVLEALRIERHPAPVFIISGHGDIATAVEAIRRGAIDFIEKPFAVEEVPARIRQTLERARARRNGAMSHHFPGRDLLTPREQDVLREIAGGASNKEAGRSLAISPRTVEVHRARIMDKLGARNAADLVRIVLTEGRA